MAEVAPATINAPTNHPRVEFNPKAPVTIRFSLDFPPDTAPCRCAAQPLNPALAVKSLESQVKAEGASLSEGADLLIIATPGHAGLQALVFILYAEAGPDGLPPVRERQGVFLLVGEIDDGRSEHRPIAKE
jgi:hypothetical protein